METALEAVRALLSEPPASSASRLEAEGLVVGVAFGREEHAADHRLEDVSEASGALVVVVAMLAGVAMHEGQRRGAARGPTGDPQLDPAE